MLVTQMGQQKASESEHAQSVPLGVTALLLLPEAIVARVAKDLKVESFTNQLVTV